VNKIKSYALLINKSIYWAHYFKITQKVAPKIGCRNEHITPIDEALTSTFRHFVSKNFIASDYFNLKDDVILTQREKLVRKVIVTLLKQVCR